MALCDGQGGAGAKSLEQWRRSWTAAAYAAEHGLLLVDVFPYEVRQKLMQDPPYLKPSHLTQRACNSNTPSMLRPGMV